MANMFKPNTSDEKDIYVYDNQSPDLVAKLGSTAIAVTSLVSAFAFLAPSQGVTSTPATNLSDAGSEDQATDPQNESPAAVEQAPIAAPIETTISSAAHSHPSLVASSHNATPKSASTVSAMPAVALAPVTQHQNDLQSIGSIGATGNTSAPTSAAGAGTGSAGSTTGNTTSPTSAAGAGGSSASGSTGGGTGNTTSPTSASASGGGNASGGSNSSGTNPVSGDIGGEHHGGHGGHD